MEYLATCFSHFGAVHMKKLCEKRGWTACLMPVPRSLSSSCGICVLYEVPETETPFPVDRLPEEVERILRAGREGGHEDGRYFCVYEAEGL